MIRQRKSSTPLKIGNKGTCSPKTDLARVYCAVGDYYFVITKTREGKPWVTIYDTETGKHIFDCNPGFFEAQFEFTYSKTRVSPRV